MIYDALRLAATPFALPPAIGSQDSPDGPTYRVEFQGASALGYCAISEALRSSGQIRKHSLVGETEVDGGCRVQGEAHVVSGSPMAAAREILEALSGVDFQVSGFDVSLRPGTSTPDRGA